MLKVSKYTIYQKITSDAYLFYNSKTSWLRIYNNKDFNDLKNKKYDNFKEFVVDPDLDEFKEVANYRISYINKEKDYIRFTIFPTMRCNARCKFCYENGEHRIDMTEEIVENTITFIKKEAIKYKKLRIYWFGGEPLVSKNIMSYISRELIEFCNINNISYRASIATNMSLLNDNNYEDFIREYKIDKIEYAFDGVEEEHNASKNYLDKSFNAFKHNLEMLPKLLNKNIIVQLRLNCTIENFEKLAILLQNLLLKYGKYKNFIPYFAMIFPTKYFNNNDKLINKTNLGYYKLKILDFMLKYRNAGMDTFPLSRGVINCYGSNPNSIVIGPTGLLSKCQGCSTNPNQSIGDVKLGINKNINYYNWCYNNITEECKTCNLYPICLGGCTDSLMSNNKKPCIKEKYYIEELLKKVGEYMLNNKISEYHYEIDDESKV